MLHQHPAISEAAVRACPPCCCRLRCPCWRPAQPIQRPRVALPSFTPSYTHTHIHAQPPNPQVVAKPDDKWGEVPCAFVSLKDGHELSEEELVAFARENLAHYKVGWGGALELCVYVCVCV